MWTDYRDGGAQRMKSRPAWSVLWASSQMVEAKRVALSSSLHSRASGSYTMRFANWTKLKPMQDLICNSSTYNFSALLHTKCHMFKYIFTSSTAKTNQNTCIAQLCVFGVSSMEGTAWETLLWWSIRCLYLKWRFTEWVIKLFDHPIINLLECILSLRYLNPISVSIIFVT